MKKATMPVDKLEWVKPLIKAEALKDKEILELKEKVNGVGKRSKHDHNGVEIAATTNKKACPTWGQKAQRQMLGQEERRRRRF